MNLSRFLVCSLFIWLFLKWVEDEFQPLNVEGYRESEASLNSWRKHQQNWPLEKRYNTDLKRLRNSSPEKGLWECVGEEVRVRVRCGGVNEDNHTCRA